MSDKHQYRRFGDFEAVRYGAEDGGWDENAPLRIARFVLGFDVDGHTTGLNERAWDVVHPVKEFWRPEEGVADLEVSDNERGARIVVGLGDWVGRNNKGRLRAFTHNKLLEGTFPVTNLKARELTIDQDMIGLIRKHRGQFNSKVPDHILSDYAINALVSFDLSTETASWPGQEGAI